MDEMSVKSLAAERRDQRRMDVHHPAQEIVRHFDQLQESGQTNEIDVVGARAAGISAVLLVGTGGSAPGGCATVSSLAALADDLLQERVST